MARVTVRLYTILRLMAGRSEVELEAKSIQDLLENLAGVYGKQFRDIFMNEKGSLRPFYRIYVNKQILSKPEAMVSLNDGDIVHIFPPLGGG